MTPSLTSHDAERLARLWSGNASDEERAEIQAWIEAHPHLERDIASLKAAWIAMESPRHHTRAVEVQAAVLRRISAPASMSRTTRQARGSGIRSWRVGIAAVAVTVLVVALPSLWRFVQRTESDVVTFVTQRAERTTVRLPDGSSVLLGPETQLRYSAGHAGQERLVELVGQAYFTVIANAKRAFIVDAGNVPVRVLGTSFSVRAYATDSSTQVAVAEGRVAVGNDSVRAVLLAGDLGDAQPGKTPAVMHNVMMADALGWTRGRMTFTDVPFRSVAVELERMYDVMIHIEDSVLKDRLITVTTTDDVRDVFDAIAIALDASWRGKGKQVVFSASRTGE